MTRKRVMDDVRAVRAWAWPRWVGLVGWFVDWDDSIPFHYVWTDWDTRHCTKWMWKWRLNGWFVCPWRDHDWYPDMCGRPAHDICSRCNDTRQHVGRTLKRWLEIEVAVGLELLHEIGKRLEAAQERRRG